MKAKAAKTTLLTAFACFSFAMFIAMRHGGAFASAQSFPQVSFDRDIRPIIAAHCLSCHGEKRSGGLRLDARATAMRGGVSGPVIVPGKAAESLLYQRITAPNEDERMPPVGERLSPAEVSALKAWIDTGAVWPNGERESGRVGERESGGQGEGVKGGQGEGVNKRLQHWAWQPIKRPAVPAYDPNSAILNPQSSISNPIDAFIAARLTQAGLKMSPEADRRVLIRRLSFDLLGLPP
ncbi:MAG: DUF1549 domain-containing protein, partial [Blastocatellia bacterium]|nr:DUF1549 domain-containing protein [Blastocatellia bacterium]